MRRFLLYLSVYIRGIRGWFESTMEKRRLGKTDMDVSVLGFGGAEIGFENASPDAVEKLLKSALDAGLNVIDTG